MPPRIDLSGTRFGRLQAVAPAGRRGSISLWLCKCDCGSDKVTSLGSLRGGKAKSCGCLRKETLSARAVKHGASRRGALLPEYRIWKGVRGRCLNARNPKYPIYGGRGITVCERWTDFTNFISDMGPRPSAQHSIDRINNDGNYEPSNCRWATAWQQARNQRPRRLRVLPAGSLQWL